MTGQETPQDETCRPAVILADDNRVLLCRFSFPHPAVPAGATVVWAAPGGGVEPGELPLGALRRELHEETGLVIDADPPHVWHQEVVAPDLADGYDGLVNDYFLIRTTPFSPRGVLSDDDLAAEHISGMQWWQHADIAAYDGTDLFSPRDLATPLASLIAGDIPDTPVIRPDQLEIIRRELAERVVERFVFESATAAVQAISCDHAATTTARRLARDGVRTRGG